MDSSNVSIGTRTHTGQILRQVSFFALFPTRYTSDKQRNKSQKKFTLEARDLLKAKTRIERKKAQNDPRDCWYATTNHVTQQRKIFSLNRTKTKEIGLI